MLTLKSVKFVTGFVDPKEYVIYVKLSNDREGKISLKTNDSGIFISEQFRTMAELLDQIMREEPDAVAAGVHPARPEAREWYCPLCLIAIRSVDVDTIPMPNRPCLYCGTQAWTPDEP